MTGGCCCCVRRARPCGAARCGGRAGVRAGGRRPRGWPCRQAAGRAAARSLGLSRRAGGAGRRAGRNDAVAPGRTGGWAWRAAGRDAGRSLEEGRGWVGGGAVGSGAGWWAGLGRVGEEKARWTRCPERAPGAGHKGFGASSSEAPLCLQPCRPSVPGREASPRQAGLLSRPRGEVAGRGSPGTGGRTTLRRAPWERFSGARPGR